MIFVSFVTCLLGIGLFVLDLTTDVQFSVEMFNKENKSLTETEDFEKLSKKLNEFNFSSPDSLNSACNAYIDFYKNYSNLTILDYEDFDVTGWISLWHCIQPFVATLIVFLSRGGKGVKSSFRDIAGPPDCLLPIFCPTPYDKLNHLLCGIPFLLIYVLWYLVLIVGSLVPLPIFTHLYRFSLEVRSHIKRSKPGFRTEIVSIEEEIRDHEALGELWKI